MKRPYKINGPTLLSFSGGSSSGFMLHNVLEASYPEEPLVVFANTGLEHEETYNFVEQCQINWGIEIHWIEYIGKGGYKRTDFNNASRDGGPFDLLIKEKKAIPNFAMRFCTQELKVKIILEYGKSILGEEYDELIGIRKDEPKRYFRINSSEKNHNRSIKMPMFEANHIIDDVDDFWAKSNFRLKIPRILSNCQGCFLKGGKILNEVARLEPSSLEWWARKEKESGRRFRKDGPSYAGLIQMSKSQCDLFPDFLQDDLPCNCTD